MTKEPFDPATDGAQMSLEGALTYGMHLNLDKILGAQQCRSDAHDEMLFIIQHQTSELWFKLVIHELNAARDNLNEEAFGAASKTLARVSRVFELLNNSWDVLRTLTPAEFNGFRDKLGPSSGFQSHQYRMVEYLLGNRNPNMMAPHKHTPVQHDALAAELERPSLYDDVVRILITRTGGTATDVPGPMLQQPHDFNPTVQAHWKIVYDDPTSHWDLYDIGEKLVDLEDYFRRWRFNHVTTAERVIGMKRGTGGTSGVDYLRRMLSVELFPELWRLRGDLQA